MRLKAVYNASYILTAQVKIFKEGEVLHSFTQNSSSLAAQIIVRKILKEITIMLLKKKKSKISIQQKHEHNETASQLTIWVIDMVSRQASVKWFKPNGPISLPLISRYTKL